MDLASAFFSMTPSKATERLLTIEEIDTEDYQFPPDSSLSPSKKTLLENIKPIKILADRISSHNLIIERLGLVFHTLF